MRRSAPHTVAITSCFMALVILELGLLTRPFTLSRPLRSCKEALYGIRAKKALAMSGLQDD
jgi:hypothetical protein